MLWLVVRQSNPGTCARGEFLLSLGDIFYEGFPVYQLRKTELNGYVQPKDEEASFDHAQETETEFLASPIRKSPCKGTYGISPEYRTPSECHQLDIL